MIGKLIGRVVGEVVAAPFTVALEGTKAVGEVAKTLDKRVSEATEPKK